MSEKDQNLAGRTLIWDFINGKLEDRIAELEQRVDKWEPYERAKWELHRLDDFNRRIEQLEQNIHDIKDTIEIMQSDCGEYKLKEIEELEQWKNQLLILSKTIDKYLDTQGLEKTEPIRLELRNLSLKLSGEKKPIPNANIQYMRCYECNKEMKTKNDGVGFCWCNECYDKILEENKILVAKDELVNWLEQLLLLKMKAIDQDNNIRLLMKLKELKTR